MPDPILSKPIELNPLSACKQFERIKGSSRLARAFLDSAKSYFSQNPYRNIWIGINLAALKHNLQIVKDRAPDKKLCAIVKCNAYGHSLELIASALDGQVDAFGISENDEAYRLLTTTRERPQILRLRLADPLEMREAIALKLGIEELVGSYQQAKTLSEIASEYSYSAPIHLSLDSTKMGRDGFSVHSEQWYSTVEQIRLISHLPNIRVVGICAHLPKSDIFNSELTCQKIIQFSQHANELKHFLGKQVLTHVFASSSMLRNSDIPNSVLAGIDMNRVGGALYGLESFIDQQGRQLKMVMNAATLVSGVFHRSFDNTVGYYSRYRVSNPEGELHANIPGGWSVVPREALTTQADLGGRAHTRIVNDAGGVHDIIGEPSMNSVVCRARSIDGSYQLDLYDMAFLMADPRHLSPVPRDFWNGINANSIAKSINSTAARVTTQLGNSQHVAHFPIDY